MGSNYKRVELPICVFCKKGIRGVQYTQGLRKDHKRRPRGRYMIKNQMTHPECKSDYLLKELKKNAD